jgi:quinol monooxygenase YgiN
MTTLSQFVSLHPYFKVRPGKLEQFKAKLPQLVAQTDKETKCLFYEFSVNGDEAFCREAYADAEGLLAHLGNVDALLKELLAMADVIRVEVHGPARELDKLKGLMAHLSPSWFALQPA